MEEKISFIREWESGDSTVAELCRSFGISRTTAYRCIRRYQKYGRAGLESESRAPRKVWNRTAKELESALVQLRRRQPRRGALKLLVALAARFPERKLPAPSTVQLILKRNGLVKKRRRVRRIREVHPIFPAKGPNDIWSVDFKGKFLMGNQRNCYPLTVMDAYSRYILAVEGMHHPTYEGTWAVFLRLFRRYGLPRQIHSDNGEPFAGATALSRLSRLAVNFLDLGIEPVYSDPGHPEQNGSHERMHAELKAEATRPAAHTMGWQQRKFDAFRHEYNERRPHQALGQRPPSQLYFPSERRMPRRISPWEYPAGVRACYVCRNGAIRWGKRGWVHVTTTLNEKHIGLEPMAKGHWRVFYRDTLLGYLDERTLRIQDNLGRTIRGLPEV